MKVVVYCQLTPMAFYRLIWPAMALQAKGYDVTLVNSDEYPWISTRPKTGKVWDVYMPDADVIVMQRITQPEILVAIDRWQRAGKRVIVDMDDDLSAVSRDHNPGAYKLMYESTHMSHVVAIEACAKADAVTVSTHALAEKYHGTVLPNRIPAAYLKMPRYKGPAIIGWTGAVKFRRNDPGVLGDAIGQLQDEGYDFGVVGHKDDVYKSFKLRRPLARFGAQSMQHYPRAMSRFTVGICPLVNIPFNRAKSWLKPLEFLALGVPCVVSNMPEYRALVSGVTGVAEHGKGVTYVPSASHRSASVQREQHAWYDALKRLLLDADYREAQSLAGRQVARRHTYEQWCELWWPVWTEDSGQSTMDNDSARVSAST